MSASNALSVVKAASFFSPGKIILQSGASDLTGIEVKELGAQKALIITDKGILKAGLIEKIKNSLSNESIAVDIFDGVELEPPLHVVERTADIVKREKYDILIGVGGGSTLDTTKGVSAIAANEGKIVDYVGINRLPKRAIPKILIPTSGGSGAEMTRVFAVTDKTDKAKKVVYSPYNLAEVVILDPLLTLSLPQKLTAESGIDALAHAIESYTSANSTPFSDILGFEAIRLIVENLPTAFAKGDDVYARYNMLLSASLAGLSWASSGLGVTHAIAYVLENLYKLSHARAVSIMLPHVMQYNSIGKINKYKNIAKVMGVNVDTLPPFDAASAAAKAMRELIERFGISVHLKDYGATEKDLQVLVEGAMQHNRLFAPNPRSISVDDIKEIAIMAMGI